MLQSEKGVRTAIERSLKPKSEQATGPHSESEVKDSGNIESDVKFTQQDPGHYLTQGPDSDIP